MRNQWTTIKQIIKSDERRKDIFLSLINADGKIICVNAAMLKELDLENPRVAACNFFDFIHPAHHDEFKNAISYSEENKSSHSMELYLKNGYYHPMKWEVNCLIDETNDEKSYLCIGYKLIDDARLNQFNQLGEKNYQLIVEGLSAGILFQDRKGELIAANQKAAEIFNTTLERLYQLNDIENLWKTIWKITTENNEPVTFDKTPFIKALQSGKAQAETLIVRLSNGEDRWILFNSQPLFDSNKSVPFSVVSNIIDVTQEKKLSNDVKERKALFDVFMNKTPNMAWVVDEDANLIFGNRAFHQYFGLNVEKSMNKNIYDLVPATVADALYEKHVQVLQTGIPVETVEKLRWADGTNLVFHVNIFPIEGITNKKMAGGHAVNLADKYAIEKQLRDANNRLLNLSRVSSDMIWEWDMQTGIITRNEPLLDMIGYPIEETKGLTWWLRRIHPEDRNRVSDKVKEIAEKGQMSWEDEYRFKCADGSYKHIHDRGFVVYENELPVKMIGSLEDVTTLKELKDQLTEEKLLHQKEISETIIHVQEKERTRIGHELHDNVNQILSTAKLFVDMLATTNSDEKDIKKKASDYIVAAVEEIRKLSRELVVPHLKEKRLADSIQNLIDDIHISTEIKIKFTHDLDNDLLSQGKKITFFRIVQEQFKNILKYSQAKKVDIHLQCKDKDCELIIKDDGIGFDPKQTPRGIGLSNIYERTRFYNGTFDIQTSPGQGCTLNVTIPLL